MKQRKIPNRIIFIIKNWKRMSVKQRAKYLVRYSPSIEYYVCGRLYVEWLTGIVKVANERRENRLKLQMEQRIDEFIELFEGYEEQNLGSITKGIVKDAIMSWVRQNGVDTLIRHKWPEEKPTMDGEYLARLDTGDEVVYKVLYIVDQYTPWTNYVTHWWELPEV